MIWSAVLVQRNGRACSFQTSIPGDPDRAIPLLEATVTQYEQTLGDTHPDTLQSRHSLVDAREEAETARESGTGTVPADRNHEHPLHLPEQPE